MEKKIVDTINKSIHAIKYIFTILLLIFFLDTPAITPKTKPKAPANMIKIEYNSSKFSCSIGFVYSKSKLFIFTISE